MAASTDKPLTWSKSLKYLPKISFDDVKMFVKVNKGPQSGLVKGYKFHHEGFIKEFEVGVTDQEARKVYIRARCFKSLKKSEEPHHLKIVFNDVTEVIQHQCSCKAGKGICNHKIAMLFQISHYNLLGLDTVPELPSKTSLPQEWHKPRTAGIHNETIEATVIKRPELKQHTKRSEARSIYGVQSNLYNPLREFPSFEFIDKFISKSKTDFSETQFSQIFSDTDPREYVESKFGTVIKGSVLSYQQPFIEDKSKLLRIYQDHPLPALPITSLEPVYSHIPTLEEQLTLDGLKINLANAHKVEEQTRDQSDNPFWHNLRKKRLTASKFKRVCSRKDDFPSLVKQLHKKTIQTAAMKYGLKHERDAAVAYVDSKSVNVYRTGFVINPGCPFLGASPDYLVYDSSNPEPFGLLEIKCPQFESAEDAKYLKTVNGEKKLKRTHEYFYQVQGQLGITGLKWCDFMVFCTDDWHIETILFDEDFFIDMYTKLCSFFYCFFLSSVIST